MKEKKVDKAEAKEMIKEGKEQLEKEKTKQAKVDKASE